MNRFTLEQWSSQVIRILKEQHDFDSLEIFFIDLGAYKEGRISEKDMIETCREAIVAYRDHLQKIIDTLEGRIDTPYAFLKDIG